MDFNTSLQVAQDRLGGAVYRELAQKYNVNESTICRVLQKDEIREVLEAGMQQQISLVPKAIDVLQDTLNQTEDAGLRLKAADTVLKNTGLSPNNSTSITLTQILNVNQNEVSPAVQRLLDQIRKSDTPPAIGEVIDV
jgi:DNA-binding transcriptional MocR family regulator